MSREIEATITQVEEATTLLAMREKYARLSLQHELEGDYLEAAQCDLAVVQLHAAIEAVQGTFQIPQ